ncbi:MAG: GYDIA family GHMP kinase [Saprospiraceae bacterium]
MYSANGKLLLTSEYYVLDGALALAVPTTFGQKLKVKETEDVGVLLWESQEVDGTPWFKASFTIPGLTCISSTDTDIAKTLHSFLEILQKANPEKFSSKKGLSFSTHLDFPRDWGLGTSSTLISLLSQWTDYDPYQLLFETMGGSGYDIACAESVKPLLYQLENYDKRKVETVDFNPSFADQLYFIYLGKKQNSRSGITHYRKMTDNKDAEIKRLTEITQEIITCRSLSLFCELITEHEAIIGGKLKLPIVKETHFKDFPGAIKSLGAWGGDFILVASDGAEEEVRDYFNKKGMEVFFKYKEMVL